MKKNKKAVEPKIVILHAWRDSVDSGMCVDMVVDGKIKSFMQLSHHDGDYSFEEVVSHQYYNSEDAK